MSFLLHRLDNYFSDALAAKLKMFSIIWLVSAEVSVASGIFGRFSPPDNGTTEDSDAPNSLTNVSGTPALSEKSKGKSSRCLMLLPSRFSAGNPQTSGANPTRGK